MRNQFIAIVIDRFKTDYNKAKRREKSRILDQIQKNHQGKPQIHHKNYWREKDRSKEMVIQVGPGFILVNFQNISHAFTS